MNTLNTIKETKPLPNPPTRVAARDWIRFGLLLSLYPVVLFLAAGTLDWLMGWVFVVIIFATTLVSRFLAARKNPDLLSERARSMAMQGAKPWDKKIVPLIGIVGPLAMVLVAGLNYRFEWLPEIPMYVQWFGVLLSIVGSVIGSWALIENKFFSGVVRIQTERGHAVVNTGPYQFVRHPGYAGAMLYYIGAPLGLGSFWALLPALFIIAMMIVRTSLEDKTLQQELPGYVEYTKQTRYRLAPGIW